MLERRRHQRFEITVPARYLDPEGQMIAGTVENISKSGVFIASTTPLPVGDPAFVTLHLPAVGNIVDLPGRVVRSSPTFGMAIEFLREQNEEIIEKLKSNE